MLKVKTKEIDTMLRKLNTLAAGLVGKDKTIREESKNSQKEASNTLKQVTMRDDGDETKRAVVSTTKAGAAKGICTKPGKASERKGGQSTLDEFITFHHCH